MSNQGHTNEALNNLLTSIQNLHFKIRDTTREVIAAQIDDASSVTGTGYGDVSYSVDTKSEDVINQWFVENSPEGGAVVISEGMGKKVFPTGLSESEARWRIIIDPLDGTRHIMYDNRSCWILTGIAPNKGEKTSLRDIVACIQTEVPVTLQSKGLVITAIRGSGARASIYDFDSGSCIDITLQASKAKNLKNGFAVFSNFFPGIKEIISKIEDHVMERLYGTPGENSALVFSEQYICNAGQLYMVVSGKYRMVADIRAALAPYQKAQNKSLPLCTHPYDLAASLIAEELGCVLVDLAGNQLDYPLDTDTNCVFICYANEDLFRHIHPALQLEFHEAVEVV